MMFRPFLPSRSNLPPPLPQAKITIKTLFPYIFNTFLNDPKLILIKKKCAPPQWEGERIIYQKNFRKPIFAINSRLC